MGKHRHDRTRGITHDANGDEIHHGTGDVLLMVTVGDPGWAGCTMRSHRSVGSAFDPLSSPSYPVPSFLFFSCPPPILTIILCRRVALKERRGEGERVNERIFCFVTLIDRVYLMRTIRRAVSVFSGNPVVEGNETQLLG